MGWVGVKLAQLREQATNTKQGDLVMDISLTERALCSVWSGSTNCSPFAPQTYSHLFGVSFTIFFGEKQNVFLFL